MKNEEARKESVKYAGRKRQREKEGARDAWQEGRVEEE
jgi:hypothetical protein